MKLNRTNYLFGNRNVAKRRWLAKLDAAVALASKAAARKACDEAVAATKPTKCRPAKRPNTTPRTLPVFRG